jgi:uncharacterized protein YjbI with pentapeptide repeats
MSGSTPVEDRSRLFEMQSLTDEVLSDLPLEGVDLSEKEFVGCTFRRLRAAESRWQRVRFEDCRFESCDLARINIRQAALRGVAFEECRLAGVDWTEIAANPVVSFDKCNLEYGSFSNANFTRTPFCGCRILNVNFIGTRLADADFTGSDLAQTRFETCDLQRASFSGARNVWFDPAHNRVRDAIIDVTTAALVAASFGLRVQGFSASEEQSDGRRLRKGRSRTSGR